MQNHPVLYWRHHQYQFMVDSYEANEQAQNNGNFNNPMTNQANKNSMLGIHATATAMIQYGRVARKHGHVDSALDQLSRIHDIRSVTIADCFEKIRQQVKCYLSAGHAYDAKLMQRLEKRTKDWKKSLEKKGLESNNKDAENNSISRKIQENSDKNDKKLNEIANLHNFPENVDLVDKNLEAYVLNEYKLGLDIIAATNVQYFSADMNAELYAMRGAFQVRLGQLEESNTSFSAAVQLSDKHVKAWAYGEGDIIENERYVGIF